MSIRDTEEDDEIWVELLREVLAEELDEHPLASLPEEAASRKPN